MEIAKVHDLEYRVLTFWGRVQETEGCWFWTGTLAPNGYGVTNFRYDGRKRYAGTHRLAYLLYHGAVPDDLQVCHSCDVNYAAGDIAYRKCVRPDHLFLGTALQNVRDAIAKGRNAYGDRSGPRLHPECLVRGDKHWKRLFPERAKQHITGACADPLRYRGEGNGNATLTEALVVEIRRLHAAGIRQTTLAARYGISSSSVSRLILRQTWAHVP